MKYYEADYVEHVGGAMLVAFSAPAFAGEEKKKDEKKGGKLTQMVYGEEKKKDEKKGGK